jgi:hypothetical protein
MSIIADYWSQLQGSLFSNIELLWQQSLSDGDKRLISILNVNQIEKYIDKPSIGRVGRKRHDRRAIARAFLAKALKDITTTKMLREALITQPTLCRICGWDSPDQVPSEPTLSRAFSEFTNNGLCLIAHEANVREYIGDQIVMHVSRDSTELPAREKPAKKPPTAERHRARSTQHKDGRIVERTRVEIQFDQTAEEAMEQLPKVCDAVVKRDSKGNRHTVIGYKVHIDWADGIIPINVALTSASVHDSQVAIPLSRLTSKRANVLYELMDGAYDAPSIRKAIEELGRVPIIDGQPRRKAYVPFDPATALRYEHRTNAERGNSRLQDSFGFRNLRVRSAAKALTHAMFGILVLFADQITKPIHYNVCAT